MSQMQVKMRQGGQLKDIPFGCNCDGSGGMDNGELAAVQKELEALGGRVADVQADLKADYPTREEVDKRLAQQATLYIGGTGASDTIIDGRGIYAGFPFETITAALAWGKTQYPAAHLIFELLGDVDEGDKDIVVSHAAPVAIGSNNTERPTLRCGRLLFMRTFGKCNNFCISNNTSIVQPALEVRLGFLDISDMRIIAGANTYGLRPWLAKLYASNLSIDCNAASYAIAASYNSALRLYGDIKVNGELSGAVLYASAQSDIYGASITGAVTGRKYAVLRQSKIYIEAGITTIPGTIAGTCDESSMVV